MFLQKPWCFVLLVSIVSALLLSCGDSPTATPNDDRYDELWGLSNTGQDDGTKVGKVGCDMDMEKTWDAARKLEPYYHEMYQRSVEIDVGMNRWVQDEPTN